MSDSVPSEPRSLWPTHCRPKADMMRSTRGSLSILASESACLPNRGPKTHLFPSRREPLGRQQILKFSPKQTSMAISVAASKVAGRLLMACPKVISMSYEPCVSYSHSVHALILWPATCARRQTFQAHSSQSTGLPTKEGMLITMCTGCPDRSHSALGAMQTSFTLLSASKQLMRFSKWPLKVVHLCACTSAEALHLP